jgi:hypothetical protein
MSNAPKKSCRLGEPNRIRNGTDRTSGQPTDRAEGRTTTPCNMLSADRANAARAWWRDGDGKILTLGAFMSLAADELVRRTLRENPEFKLPPDCAFEFTRIEKQTTKQNATVQTQ